MFIQQQDYEIRQHKKARGSDDDPTRQQRQLNRARETIGRYGRHITHLHKEADELKMHHQGQLRNEALEKQKLIDNLEQSKRVIKNMERMHETTNKNLLNARRQLMDYHTLMNEIRDNNVQLINESMNTELDVDQRVQNVLRRAESAEHDVAYLVAMVEEYRKAYNDQAMEM